MRNEKYDFGTWILASSLEALLKLRGQLDLLSLIHEKDFAKTANSGTVN